MRSFIRLNLLLFSLSFFLVFGSSSGIAANLDVCRDGCPYQTIQVAIDAANLGDLIRIAASQDAYSGPLVLNGTKDLTIEGGWDLQTGISTSNPGSTVIQGDGDTPVIDISTSGNSTLTFRNLTVSGGGNGIEALPESGSLALRLEQIVVKDNESAGIRVSSSYGPSQITVDASNLWITNNRGGIYLLVVMGQEGLVYSQKGRMPMQEEGLVCMANFTNCTITNNNEGIGGVVLGSPYYGETNVTLTNCIVWGNNATTDGDYNEPRPRDIYLPCSYYNYSSDNVSLDHCDIGELVYDGCCTTVSLVDPLWVDPLLLDDFHLSSDSPCIDSGTAVDSPLTDIEGQPRPLGDQFDIGADEVLDCESDQQGPGMVQDLTALFSSGSIILSWQNPSDPDLDGLLLYRLGPGDTEPQMVQVLDKTTETATIENIVLPGLYTLTLVPRDLCGNLGEQAQIEITVTEGPIAYLPFLATSEGWTTEIFIANASERVANVHLDLFIDGLVSHFEDYTIPPDGILRIPIDQGDAGILHSTESIVALVHISGNAGSAWYPAALFPETELYIPYIEADQHWWTGLTLFNPLGFTNHIILHNDNGLDIPLTLPPHGQISLDLCNYIEDSGIDCGDIRSGRLVSTDGAAFVGVSSIAARNWPGADMAIMLLSGDSANVLDVPYIGDNRYSWTGIAVLQTQGMFQSILVQPFSSTGPEAGVEFISSDPEGQSQVALNLSAWIDGTKVRWAEVSLPYLVDEDLRITGSILYSTRDGFDLVNASKLRFRDAVIPILGNNTSLCLLNPHETLTSFAYTTFDEQGNRLVSDTIVLNPRAMGKINLNENFGPSVTHLRILASDTLIGVLQGSEGNNENRSPVLSVLGEPEGITQ